MTSIKSKKAVVSIPPSGLFMAFTDLRNFVKMLPEDKRGDISADYDTLTARVQGFDVGVKIVERIPYSKIVLKDNGAPFAFTVTVHFDDCPDSGSKTDFFIEAELDLNFMMKMLLETKIKQALDKVVDGLVAVSEGKIPEGADKYGFDENLFKK